MKIEKFFERGWRLVSNLECCDPRGGDSIWVFWNHVIWLAEILSCHKQYIHLKFVNVGGYSFLATFIYYKNKTIERCVLWESLRCVENSITSKCWVIQGDFNKMLNAQERLGQHYADEFPKDFRQMLQDTNLTKMDTIGGFFT